MIVKANSPSTRTALALNLAAMLKHLEWSQNELARRSGVSQKHINNAVNMRTSSSIEVVDLMAKAMGIPGWALVLPGLDGERMDSVMGLANLIASWIGADDSSRDMLESLARKLAKI